MDSKTCLVIARQCTKDQLAHMGRQGVQPECRPKSRLSYGNLLFDTLVPFAIRCNFESSTRAHLGAFDTCHRL